MEGNMDKHNIENKPINNWPESLKPTIASNLRFLRINTRVEEPETGKVRYMGQKDLAKLMGFATQQVSKIELCKNSLSAIQIFQISKIFDVSVNSMFEDLTKTVYEKTIKLNA
jgi:transcriptional regulator with XRE-family HTH domain